MTWKDDSPSQASIFSKPADYCVLLSSRSGYLEYLHDGFYTAVGPLRLYLKPQHIFGTHLALGVQHAALDIHLHLHSFT